MVAFSIAITTKKESKKKKRRNESTTAWRCTYHKRGCRKAVVNLQEFSVVALETKMQQVGFVLEWCRKVFDFSLLVVWNDASWEVDGISLLIGDAFHSTSQSNLVSLQRSAWSAKTTIKIKIKIKIKMKKESQSKASKLSNWTCPRCFKICLSDDGCHILPVDGVWRILKGFRNLVNNLRFYQRFISLDIDHNIIFPTKLCDSFVASLRSYNNNTKKNNHFSSVSYLLSAMHLTIHLPGRREGRMRTYH